MPRPKGIPKTGGRQKGTPNKATRPFKEFMTAVTEGVEYQDVVRDSILAGRAELYFKAAEHAFGKPKEYKEVKRVGSYILPEGDDVGGED